MSPFQKARPTLTSADLNRSVNGSRWGEKPTPTGAPIDYGFSTTSVVRRPAATQPTTPAMATPAAPSFAARATPPMAQPALDDLTGFARENAAANAGIYEPGSFGAANAVANNTGRPYAPPQQTERANPLSGDSNRQVPMTTRTIRTPFSTRLPGSTPEGDDTVAGSMQGTLSRLRANFNDRRSTQPSPYPAFLSRAMSDT